MSLELLRNGNALHVAPETPAARLLVSYPDIALRLHADRIRPDEQTSAIVKITDARTVSRLYTAFRATPRQAGVSLGRPCADPMTVADFARRITEFDERTQSAVASLTEHFRSIDHVITLRVPAYALGRGSFLILDGNHRTTALFLSGRRFVLELDSLFAPVDRRYLIDLKYFDGGLRRFISRARRGRRRGVV